MNVPPEADVEVSVAVVCNDNEPESAPNIENPAVSPKPLRCGDCHQHQYYSDGELRTSTGEIVDTSKRTPTGYTHYCLGVPSGFRKLKHAVDWSGGETPPKWCPLKAPGDASVVANGERVTA